MNKDDFLPLNEKTKTYMQKQLQNCFIYHTKPVGDGPKNVGKYQKKKQLMIGKTICAEEVSQWSKLE